MLFTNLPLACRLDANPGDLSIQRTPHADAGFGHDVRDNFGLGN